MSLVTRCPKCESRFLIDSDQLSEHDGLVRCGECSHIFDGNVHLENKLPTLTRRLPAETQNAALNRPAPVVAAAVPISVMSPHPARTSGAVPANPFANIPNLDLDSDDPEEVEPSVMRHRPISAMSEPRLNIPPAEDLPLRGEARIRPAQPASESAPVFSGSEEGMSLGGILFWGLGCFVAVILVCGQLIYIYRNDILASTPLLRPALEAFCNRLSCEVSLPRHLDDIKIEKTMLDQTGTQQQEGQPNEQVLRLTLRNDYPKSQPWPHLMIELTDASSTVVVRKAISPAQYLPPKLLGQPFTAYEEVRLALPMTVTGMQINGFHIQKFFP